MSPNAVKLIPRKQLSTVAAQHTATIVMYHLSRGILLPSWMRS